MGVVVNHILSALLSPLGLWFNAMVVVAILVRRGWKRSAWILAVASTAFLWIFSSGWLVRVVGIGLEREFPPVPTESFPQADAIVILGGGMGSNPEVSPYPEMYSSADRVWHAARLWKAGKAPIVMASGTNEVFSTKPLLLDLGVPESAIRIENEARNTEQNAKFVAQFLQAMRTESRSAPVQARTPNAQSLTSRPKILLVTSAWHMRRAKLMFERYASDIDVLPAACDHEAYLSCGCSLGVGDFFPGGEALMRNTFLFKEIVGYWGYRIRGW